MSCSFDTKPLTFSPSVCLHRLSLLSFFPAQFVSPSSHLRWHISSQQCICVSVTLFIHPSLSDSIRISERSTSPLSLSYIFQSTNTNLRTCVGDNRGFDTCRHWGGSLTWLGTRCGKHLVHKSSKITNSMFESLSYTHLSDREPMKPKQNNTFTSVWRCLLFLTTDVRCFLLYHLIMPKSIWHICRHWTVINSASVLNVTVNKLCGRWAKEVI